MNARLLAALILGLLAPIVFADSITAQSGDTLWSIAQAHGTTVKELVALNHLTSMEIEAGQQLTLPDAADSPQSYQVKAGDTLAALARRFGTSVEQLEALNHLGSTEIKVGQVLTLSGTASVAPSAPSERYETYKVQAGDTLSKLARSFGTSVGALEALNPGVNPEQLRVGERLEVEGGAVQPDPTYTPKPGDTLTSIAETFGIPLLALQLANPDIGFSFDPGTTFDIPVELSSYTVQHGDTIAHIAAAHKLNVTALLAVNPQLHAGQMLEVGHTVILPLSEDSYLRAEAVAIARRYVGYPYATVGDTPRQGFSCVGLTHWIYQEMGFDIPGNLEGQYGSFPKVSRADLRPGDIVFFRDTVWRGLSHAALYIGGGKIIHAVNFHYGVKVGSLSQPYYQSRYIGAVDPLSVLGAPPTVFAAAGP